MFTVAVEPVDREMKMKFEEQENQRLFTEPSYVMELIEINILQLIPLVALVFPRITTLNTNFNLETKARWAIKEHVENVDQITARRVDDWLCEHVVVFEGTIFE